MVPRRNIWGTKASGEQGTMASNVAVRRAPWREKVLRVAARSGGMIAGIALVAAALLMALAMLSYHRADSALNTVSGGAPLNWIGTLPADSVCSHSVETWNEYVVLFVLGSNLRVGVSRT